MGKKKKKSLKVWCFYCEREFEDEKILIQHQKAKHFKCHVCHKKLSTAGGMVVHVLQVHKESITKVPNAKPERESTDLEIFGMEGIPPEIIASHDGGQGGMDVDEKPAKFARVEGSPSYANGGPVMRSNASLATKPSYGTIPHTYMSSLGAQGPCAWPMSPSLQEWNSSQPGPTTSLPPLTSQVLQPLFPIQTVSAASLASVSSLLPSHPLFPITSPPSSSAAALPTSQAKSSLVGYRSSSGPTGCVPSSLPVPIASTGSRRAVNNVTAGISIPVSVGGQMSGSSPSSEGIFPVSLEVTVATPSANHMYASAPSTNGPSIGPPPVISNKPPGPVGIANEVYLLWDDEVMSMEERRLSLPRYQVVDETLQMNSIDAAIDRRIMEGRLAGRMGFGA